MKSNKVLFFLILILCASVFAGVPNVVSELDLDKYKGKWYEVARFPNGFQKKCERNVSAEYRLLEKGLIEVVNSCVEKNGNINKIKGLAKKQKTGISSKLEVSFFDILGWRPIWGDYWVLYLDDSYQTAIVGDRNTKYGWILSRNKILLENQREKVLNVLTEQGYDIQQLIYTKHD